MPTGPSTSVTSNTEDRGGRELDEALLEAAWAQLTEHGYANFTLDAVALQARTSTPVLYRRWPTRHALVEAAITHAAARRPVEIPDTGTYRGDLLAMMRRANQTRADLLAGMAILLGAYFTETGLSPADLRAKVLGLRQSVADTLPDRAVQRGEADPAVVSARSHVPRPPGSGGTASRPASLASAGDHQREHQGAA